MINERPAVVLPSIFLKAGRGRKFIA
jgi:hypothetical protein